MDSIKYIHAQICTSRVLVVFVVAIVLFCGVLGLILVSGDGNQTRNLEIQRQIKLDAARADDIKKLEEQTWTEKHHLLLSIGELKRNVSQINSLTERIQMLKDIQDVEIKATEIQLAKRRTADSKLMSDVIRLHVDVRKAQLELDKIRQEIKHKLAAQAHRQTLESEKATIQEKINFYALILSESEEKVVRIYPMTTRLEYRAKINDFQSKLVQLQYYILNMDSGNINVPLHMGWNMQYLNSGINELSMALTARLSIQQIQQITAIELDSDKSTLKQQLDHFLKIAVDIARNVAKIESLLYRSSFQVRINKLEAKINEVHQVVSKWKFPLQCVMSVKELAYEISAVNLDVNDRLTAEKNTREMKLKQELEQKRETILQEFIGEIRANRLT